MARTEKVLLITGATGRQGGAVLRALTRRAFKLRALTRKPDSDAAKALATTGVEIVKGDLDDESSLRQALNGAWGVFGVQNTWEAGVEREEVQGKRLARLAKEAGVQHFVYSSVASAHVATGIPFFENKWRIEGVVRELAFPSHVILRPSFFMENLLRPWYLDGDKLYSALKPETKIQMIAVEDVGRFAAQALSRGAAMNRREVDLASDSVTIPQAAAVLGKALGKEISHVPIPMADVRETSAGFALMLEWFDRGGYDADIGAVEREFGFKPLTLDAWAQKTVKK